MSKDQFSVVKQPESNPYSNPGSSSSAPPFEQLPSQPPGYPDPNYPNYQSQYAAQATGAAPNVIIVSQQPQTAFSPKGQPQNIRDWSSGMCECCEDVTGCLYCTFCFPCFTCTLANKMNECCLGPLCCPGFLVAMRSKFRGQHGIRGSIFDDTCAMMWCTPCVSHQLYRELDKTRYL